jgi:lipid-binding SYLF domain-containing protein
MSMLQTLTNTASQFFSVMGQDNNVLETLDGDVRDAVARLQSVDPGLRPLLDTAHAYAVFPSIGKAVAVIGGAFGKGEVFERGQLIGYAAVAQLSSGMQAGGQPFSQIVVFEHKPALERFKEGGTTFAAYSSAMPVRPGSASAALYESGVAVFAHAEGAVNADAAIGSQKFFFRPAATEVPAGASISRRKAGTRGKVKSRPKRAKVAKRARTTAKKTRRKTTVRKR